MKHILSIILIVMVLVLAYKISTLETIVRGIQHIVTQIKLEVSESK